MTRHRANKTALVSYGVMDAILVACYLLEVVKNNRAVGCSSATEQVMAIPTRRFTWFKKKQGDRWGRHYHWQAA